LTFRSFQHCGVFCILNVGVSGLIQDQESIEYLKKNHQIGDIVEVLVTSDFDMPIDSKRPRPIIMITVPEERLKPAKVEDDPGQASSGLLTCFKQSNAK
jgi:transcriptional accessory protein Tex/SPT6